MPSVPKLQPAQVSSASAAAAAEAAKGQIRQANESLILEAAERVFAGAGFSGATMAAIAEASGLPKANLHYYFGNKQDLYRAVLARTLSDWLAPTHGITPEADPAVALGDYIPAQMRLSQQRPHASKVFANELLHGARCCRPCWRPSCATWCCKRPPCSTAGWPRAAWRRATPCTCSSPSGLPPRPMPTLRCRSPRCWGAAP